MKKGLLFFVVILWSVGIGFAQAKQLTILHTNDVHSQIDPANNGEGGIIRAAAYINEVRASEKNVLLLSAGDFFQGTPYFNVFFGKIEIELMNALRYDAACLGNHEFDNGMDSLANRLREAQFPIVVANYDVAQTPLHDKVKPYIIIKKDGLKIGIFGIGTPLKGLVIPRQWGDMQIKDPIETTNTVAKKLREKERCDVVLCLSHLGYNADIVLAESTRYIDVIVGGHSHTTLETADIRKNLDGKDVYITQAGSRGVYVGRVDITVSGK